MIGLLLRLLLAIAVVWLAIYLVKQLTNKTGNKSAGAAKVQNQKLHTCAHCGIYLPESEAIASNDKYYCCQAHLDQDKKT